MSALLSLMPRPNQSPKETAVTNAWTRRLPEDGSA